MRVGCAFVGLFATLSVMWDQEKATRFGKALRELRESRGLTQERYAYRAGITKNQVQLLEAARSSGKAENQKPSNPTMATLYGLASGFDMTLSEFFAKLDM